MELWCGPLDCRDFDRFTTLKTAADFFRPSWREWGWEHSCTLQSTSARPSLAIWEDISQNWMQASEVHFGTKITHQASQFPGFIKRGWQPCGHWWDTEDNVQGGKVWLGFGSTSTLSFLSWLVLLWSWWCHSQTTYHCEVGFSTLVGLKSKQRYQINVDLYESENPECVVR